MQSGGKQGCFAQRVQHKPGGRLGGAVTGKHGLCRSRAQPHGAQRRHPADKPIHQHGHTRQRSAQKHPAQPGDIKAAQFAQYVQYVIGVGGIAGDAPPDGVHLAGKPCIGKPRTAPGHGLHRLCQQHGGYGAGGGGVANAHLAGGHKSVALGGKLPDQGDAPANGLHCLGAGHGRAFGKVRSPGGNAAVPHAGYRRTGNAQIHRQHIAVRRLCHPAYAGAPRSKVLGYGAGHALVGLAYALRHHAVVCTEHRHRPAGKIKLRRAGQRSGIFQQGLQCAQPTQGLGKAGPVGMGGGAGGFVRRGDSSKQLHQFSFGHFCHPLCFKKCCAACTKRRGRAVPAQ